MSETLDTTLDASLSVDGAVAFVEERAESEFVNPNRLSDARRAELIEKAQKGKILELPYRAQVYWDVHNANHWRVNPEHIDELVAQANADAAIGRPPQILLDHGDAGACAAPTVRKRVGHVTRVTAVTNAEGVRGLVEEAVITDPAAQVAFLRKQLDRFSVGIHRVSEAKCSICGSVGTRRDMGCKHAPGKSYDGQVCEEFVRGHLAETSFVVSPAVPDTLVLSTISITPNTDQVTADAPRSLEVTIPDPAADAQKAAEEKRMNDRIAELEAQLAAQKAEAQRLVDANFALVFDQAVREGRLMQAERDDIHDLFEAKKHDVEWLKAFVSRRQVNPVLGPPSAMQASEPTPRHAAKAKGEDALQLARAMVAANLLPASHATPEALERIGYFKLSIPE